MKWINTIKSVENSRFIIGLYEGANSLYYIGWANQDYTHIAPGVLDLNLASQIFDQKLIELEMN